MEDKTVQLRHFDFWQELFFSVTDFFSPPYLLYIRCSWLFPRGVKWPVHPLTCIYS